MAKKNIDPDDEPLSDDPEENLRMENELLKLKIQAQFGGFSSEGGNLPPEIENEFLKNVLAFEENHGKEEPKKMIEVLGNPSFKRQGELDDKSVKKEFKRLEKLLKINSIAVEFMRERDDRFKYTFITEELFNHHGGTGFPGMTMHYIYEEFHPDHEMEIKRRTDDFIRHWFEREFNEYSLELDREFVLPNRKILSREDTIKKMQTVFDCFTEFKNEQIAIREVKFELYDESESGMGHSEGAVRYDAVMESGEVVHFEGPFKLYMCYRFGGWAICYFVFPGFEW
jgi:hypothetical protein